jgi:hypothetical protein
LQEVTKREEKNEKFSAVVVVVSDRTKEEMKGNTKRCVSEEGIDGCVV